MAAWAASGAMSLTGRPNAAPLGPPRGLVPTLAAVGELIAVHSARLGRPVTLDPLALLGERAALVGLHRRGTVSCGGHTRLLRTADGYVAVSLARAEDAELVPAWLELPDEPADPWAAVVEAMPKMQTNAVVDRARLLGLPVAALAAPPTAPAGTTLPVRAIRHCRAPTGPVSLFGTRVVDLSALWAGPLCTNVLHLAGATVIKVESVHRPDGMRSGPAPFFDLLNGGKRSVALDLRTPDGRDTLGRLLAAADVVVESSRPRALEQLGLRAVDYLRAPDGPRVWLSITGYGRPAPGRNWVAFGDDAAVAGGLVAWDSAGPVFCADAIADPTSGLVAAAACLGALATDSRWLIDVAMARVAARLAGPTLPVPGGVVVAPPRARPVAEPARPLGIDTDAVLAEAGVG